LTSKGFVHRDLATRNVLLGEDRAVKIADFGLLRHTYDEIYETKNTKKLPIKWTAPEALSNGLYTSKSDVYVCKGYIPVKDKFMVSITLSYNSETPQPRHTPFLVYSYHVKTK